MARAAEPSRRADGRAHLPESAYGVDVGRVERFLSDFYAGAAGGEGEEGSSWRAAEPWAAELPAERLL